MDINYYGTIFPKVRFYPDANEKLKPSSIKNEDGYWFGLCLGDCIPINVNLFFFERKWQTNCEYCQRKADGEWNHYFDSKISCKNIKIKYIN